MACEWKDQLPAFTDTCHSLFINCYCRKTNTHLKFMHAIYQQKKNKTRLETRWQTAKKGLDPKSSIFQGIYMCILTIYIYTWNPFVLCFASKRRSFSNQHKGHWGSRYIYIYTTHKSRFLPLYEHLAKKGLWNLQLTDKKLLTLLEYTMFFTYLRVIPTKMVIWRASLEIIQFKYCLLVQKSGDHHLGCINSM